MVEEPRGASLETYLPDFSGSNLEGGTCVSWNADCTSTKSWKINAVNHMP